MIENVLRAKIYSDIIFVFRVAAAKPAKSARSTESASARSAAHNHLAAHRGCSTSAASVLIIVAAAIISSLLISTLLILALLILTLLVALLIALLVCLLIALLWRLRRNCCAAPVIRRRAEPERLRDVHVYADITGPLSEIPRYDFVKSSRIRIEDAKAGYYCARVAHISKRGTIRE